MNGGTLFPLELSIEDGKTYIRKNFSDNKTLNAGTQIVAIDKVEIQKIISGIYPQLSAETPYFKKPTINIGERQNGRFFHKSIINSNYQKKQISNSIKKALSKNFNLKIKKMNYYFGSGKSSEKIIKIIKSIKIDQKFIRKQLEK